MSKLTKDVAFDWYAKQVRKYGVEHPNVVWNEHDTRQEAIDDQAQLLRLAFKPKAGRKVLEFGAGNLLTHDALIALGLKEKDYHGVEIVPVFVAYANKRRVNVTTKIPKRTFHTGVMVGSLAACRTQAQMWEFIAAVEQACSHSLILTFTVEKERGVKVIQLNKLVEKYGDALRLTIEDSMAVATINLKELRA